MREKIEIENHEEIIRRARCIKLLLMDCDGVLTDGKLYFSSDGEELKVFHVRDGQGIVSWHQAGFISGIISGRKSLVVEKRAAELGIKYVTQASSDKVSDCYKILKSENISIDEVAFIGDAIGDIELMKIVGLPVAVADADEEVKKYTKYKTFNKGGIGAVRELINLLLKYKV